MPFYIIIFMLCAASPVFAADPVEIPEITVWGTKSPVRDTHSVVSVKNYRERSLNLPEILAREAGVHLIRYGSSDQASSISIRGSDPGEVEFYLDGIPLSTATGQSVDLSPFELEDLESIDVHRGLGPATLGSAPAVGLIQLKSARIKKGSTGLASLQVGSFNSVKEVARASYGAKRWGILFSQAVSRTSGNFVFSDDNGTPVNPADDTRAPRRNNAALTVHPYLRVYYDFDDDKRLELVNHVIFKHQGVPGMSSNQSVTANLSQSDALMGLRFNDAHFLSDKLALTNQVYVRLAKSQYTDVNGEIGLGGAQDNDNDQKVIGNRTEITWQAGVRHEVSGAVALQYEDFRPEDFLALPTAGKVSSRKNVTVSVEDRIRLAGGRLEINPAIWFVNVFNDLSDADPSFLTPSTLADHSASHPVSARLGVLGKMNSWLTLAAHAGRSARLPHFSELFGDKGGVVGNPFLKTQKEWNFDVSLTVAKPKLGVLKDLSFRGTFFDRRVTDLIEFEQNVGFARAENVGEAHVLGAETTAHAIFYNHVGLGATYTFQQARDEANNKGRFLPGRPQHEVHLNVDVFNRWWKLYANLDWADRYFLDPLNTRVVKDRLMAAFGAEATFKKHWVASLEARNVTNSQVIDAVGFPLPGRSYWGKLTYKW